MKRNLRKLFSVAVILSMLSILAACGESKTDSDTTGSSTTITQSESTSGQVSTTSTSNINNTQKVTLKILASSMDIKNPGIQKDPVAIEIERVTGVTMDITALSGTDYDTRVAALVATGDLPDIVANVSTKTNTLLTNSNSLIDLSNLIKTNGQNFLKDKKLTYAVNFNKKFKSNQTDKLFSVPLSVGNQADPTNAVVSPFIRWDYYKELGYPKCENSDDLLNVLGNMQEKHPKSENGKKAYGLSLFTDWGLWPITASMMMDGYTNSSILLIDISNDNEPTSLYTDKLNNFWKWVNFYYKANKLGILDPDSLTMKFADYTNKIQAGQTYYEIPGWINHSYIGKTPDQGFAAVKLNPDSDKYDYKYGVVNGQDQYGVTTNCKTPDRAMDLFNYFASYEGIETMINGVKGQTWDAEKGVPVLKQSIIDEQNKADPGFKDKYGMMKYSHFIGLFNPEIDPNYNTPFDFQKTDAAMSKGLMAYEKDQTIHYNVTLPGQIFSNKTYSEYLGAPGAALPALSNEMKRIEDKINAFAPNAVLAMIASKDDTAFNSAQDKFIKDLNAMGYDKLLKSYQDNWKKVKTDLDSFGKLN